MASQVDAGQDLAQHLVGPGQGRHLRPLGGGRGAQQRVAVGPLQVAELQQHHVGRAPRAGEGLDRRPRVGAQAEGGRRVGGEQLPAHRARRHPPGGVAHRQGRLPVELLAGEAGVGVGHDGGGPPRFGQRRGQGAGFRPVAQPPVGLDGGTGPQVHHGGAVDGAGAAAGEHVGDHLVPVTVIGREGQAGELFHHPDTIAGPDGGVGVAGTGEGADGPHAQGGDGALGEEPGEDGRPVLGHVDPPQAGQAEDQDLLGRRVARHGLGLSGADGGRRQDQDHQGEGQQAPRGAAHQAPAPHRSPIRSRYRASSGAISTSSP